MNDTAKVHFSSTIAASGGHIRLVSGAVAAPTEYDFVGWGTATKPLGAAAPAPSAGVVLSRSQNSAGAYENTLNNASDFVASDTQAVIVAGGVAVSEQLDLTELLPNPASPATDATGEFIEIYNPNDHEVSLRGYKLLTGNTLNHSFTFKDQAIGAGAYKAFYVGETKASLSNTSGKAQLQDAAGNVLSETAAYNAAPSGSSWSFTGSDWQWSGTPTPNAVNIRNTNTEDAVATKAKATTKKATATKAKTTSTKAKAGAASTGSGAVLSDNTDKPATKSLHTGVLAGVGALALVYGAYEYRQDFANTYLRIKKLRRNRKAG
jgi:hypothetical protein